ncbi:ankyrin repeat domain-containing protein 39-like [Strongylocentrotus purpuratus]|uniref:Ankyrin repeat domain-containing protein 39 n=1 Tax=Strongylocentrotus purpuratus TaxID=7668 RepID=A0A7M7NKU0_STRPU|nr:ankyrin repeat domain-containing protein 39-like [Strongylocentrotus purpuratus]
MGDTHHHQGDSACCAKPSPTPSLTQTLDELDWERGIWNAALSGDLAGVQKLLSSGCDVNTVDKSGYTALHYACRNGHRDIVSTLLQHGANPNVLTRSGRASPLHRAAYGGHLEIVSQLLLAKADAGLVDSDAKTALHKAAERGHVDICKVLVQAQPSLKTAEDNRGQTPLDCVKDNFDPRLRQLLS